MKIVLAGTFDEVREEIFALAAKFDYPERGESAPAPTPITNGTAPKRPGRPVKAPVDTAGNAAAAPPAAPAPAEPTSATGRSMMPMCKKHAANAPPGIKPIPAEESACTPCQNDKTMASTPKGPRAMSLDEVKAVAEGLMGSRADGADVCFSILESLGAESLSGAEDTKALPAEKREEFAKACLAAMPAPATPAAPARRSL